MIANVAFQTLPSGFPFEVVVFQVRVTSSMQSLNQDRLSDFLASLLEKLLVLY